MHVREDPEITFLLFLARGVTTVRNMDAGDGWLDHVALRRAVAEGRLPGPRYLVSGPVLDPRVLPGPEAVEPVLEEHVARGYDFVKVHADLTPETYDALLEGAARRGLRVVGHAQRQRETAQTLRLESVAHAEEFYYLLGPAGLADPGTRADLARQVAAAGTWVCPTLAVYRIIADYVDDERLAELRVDPDLAFLPRHERRLWLSDENEYRARGWRSERAAETLRIADLLGELVGDLHAAGVPLLLGTDSFGALVPGFSVVHELELLVDAGLSPYEALRTATVNVGRFLGEPGGGTIAPGSRTSLVLVGDDPLEDVAAVGDVRGVYHRGRWMAQERLLDVIGRIEERYAD